MFLPLYDSNKIAHIEFPFVNYGLLGFSILIFFLQWAGGSGALDLAHIQYGMIPVVVTGQEAGPAPWLPDQITLVSYMFLHADWVHLIGNMLFLWVFGDNIEDALGHLKYLAFYLLCGFLAGLGHLLINPDSYAPLVGASGAVAGVIGAYAVLYPHVRVFVLNRIVLTIPLVLPAWLVLGAWIAAQFVYLAIGADDGVAWFVHIVGVVVGAGLVLVFRRSGVALFGGRS